MSNNSSEYYELASSCLSCQGPEISNFILKMTFVSYYLVVFFAPVYNFVHRRNIRMGVFPHGQITLYQIRLVLNITTLQRFILTALESFEFLVSQNKLRVYIITAWFVTFFAKLWAFVDFWFTGEKGASISYMKLIFISSILSNFFVNVFCCLVYIKLFWKLFNLPRLNKYNRPEITCLYEGVPLLVIRTMVLITQFNLDFEDDLEFFIYFTDFDIAYLVISTALLQFTYILSYHNLRIIVEWLMSKKSNTVHSTQADPSVHS
ncbi:unnamed protein product [Caenorhabditis angaria]|uniref:Uncharacterized protein n=1 Tax=Caenorhabditis angaria TaxID=860376 RepID=A0A9P1IVP0_9PELO|nr:unnamed protein product [Caenorhabditis angaria]